jgi:ABC-type transport system involved in multi-copper enzyme maturation permease subunit
MIRPLLGRTFRHHARLLAFLALSLVMFQWVIVWVAARIETGPGFQQLFRSLLPPQVAESVFGQLGFASFGGAISFGFQHPFNLVAAIALMMVVATIPAAERETGFLDLLLARPLTRPMYLTATVAVLTGVCLLVPASLLVGTAAGLAMVDAPEAIHWSRYIPSAGGLALLLFCIGGYTLLLSTAAKRRGAATTRAVGLTLVFYWLDFMGAYWGRLEIPRRLSPFHYFDPADAARNGLDPTHGAILALAGCLFVAVAFWNFQRQDL